MFVAPSAAAVRDRKSVGSFGQGLRSGTPRETSDLHIGSLFPDVSLGSHLHGVDPYNALDRSVYWDFEAIVSPAIYNFPPPI